jgi:hypothetical protein
MYGAKLQVYQGNMWTADCSYIRQLLPPSSYMYTQMCQDLLERLYKENECLSQSADGTMAGTTRSWNLTDPGIQPDKLPCVHMHRGLAI